MTRAIAPIARRAEAGFTLAELLVSLGIMGFAASLLLAGLGSLWVVSKRDQDRDARDASIASAQLLLRRQLERISGVVRSDSTEAIIDAEGNDREFAFYAPPVARAAPDALQRYKLTLTATGDLMLYVANSLTERANLQEHGVVGWTPVKLLGDVRSLELRYFGADRSNGGSGWQRQWNGQPQPPELIAIRLGFAAGDRRFWPDLIVHPRVTTNIACRIGATTSRCEGPL